VARPAIALVVVCAAIACSDRAEPATSSTSTSTSNGSTTSATPTSSEGAADTSTGPAGDGILQCVETCEVPSECCLPGTPCPGPYPYNVDCKDGRCVAPHCEDDDDCAAIHEGGVCRPVRGRPSCVLPCDDDAACAVFGTHYLCVGTTDLGERHCFEHCDQQGVFCGNATCDPTSGLCVCTGDGQCQSDWTCVD